MNINKEIEEMKEGVQTNIIIEKLKLEREELEKKFYLFKIIELANGIKEMIDSNVFVNNEVGAIKISNRNNDETNESYFYHQLYDLDGKEIPDLYKRNDFVPELKLMNLFNGMYGFSEENVSSEMLGQTKYIELKPGAEERVYDLLLSKELKEVAETIKPLLNTSNKKTKLKY